MSATHRSCYRDSWATRASTDVPTDALKIEELLAIWGAGDRQALEALLPLLYDELRKVARQQMRKVPSARTLEPTALVHEAYLSVHQQFHGQFQDKSHFVAVCPRRRVQTFSADIVSPLLDLHRGT